MMAAVKGRPPRQKATRTVVAGALRADAVAQAAGEARTRTECVVVAPAPDWVALEIATGALLRAGLAGESDGPVAGADVLAGAGPLEAVALTLGPPMGSWDPARPEAVTLEAVEPSRGPSRRAVRRLATRAAAMAGEGGLLGSVGPSLAYADLTGSRPSVVLLCPSGGVRIDPRGPGAHGAARFRLGSREHTLPLAEGAGEWLREVELAGGARRRRGRSVLLAVGLGPPERGQVRKVVLGVVPLG